MKGKNVTIFGLGAIGGFIGGNVFAFYKMLHSKRIRKALTDIVADKIETVLYGEECHSPKNNSRVSYSYYHKNKNIRNKTDVFRLLTITIWLVYQAMCIQTLNMDG